MLQNKCRGFTLIELLVVVAIIGILAAVGVVAYNGYAGAAKRTATITNHKNLAKIIRINIFKANALGESVFLTTYLPSGSAHTVEIYCCPVNSSTHSDHYVKIGRAHV